jgi:hypothetical protein
MPATTAPLDVQSRSFPRARTTAKRASILDKYFYFFMTLLIAAVVVYGFSHTVGNRLIHPAVRPPFILSIHAAVFTGWLVFLILQSALVRTHNVPLHRLTGWFGVALGAAIPVVGVTTAVTMTRFRLPTLHSPDDLVFILVPFWDVVAFSTSFALAIYWRKKPEFHRRLILLASCALTAAAFGRFPAQILPPVVFYAGVDLLILLGVIRDLIVNRRIHPVYLYGLPGFTLGQAFVMYTVTNTSAWWMKIAHAIAAG